MIEAPTTPDASTQFNLDARVQLNLGVRGGEVSKDTWPEYQQLVLTELTRYGETMQALDGKIDEIRANDLVGIRVEIATLKVKSSLWGGIVGGLAGLIPILVALLLHIVAPH